MQGRRYQGQGPELSSSSQIMEGVDTHGHVLNCLVLVSFNPHAVPDYWGPVFIFCRWSQEHA